ncbi:UTP--glucose-1-phosphate uridylyltransferase GalU [Sporolactobacillus sp. CQH2019]|uniref:UTP--glucose-1-phosphate uridylyltransferase GalU n=1 Tax=Sporolactobacillus sp. CQH2019 TaxID=3023512 RepID=UPI0023677FAC|nr:UTP--glucose-1-phosphate uridylyltransferase GalU [Sporolactobacillus sp. CQH2019]MDD9147237.1 UTP--glucose-1-phosphate uridylyltransferase GalU [Sporolactobacillus sp. CQH2019]
MQRVRKAIIPAAGLGTRFLPATKAMPKEMLPIVDKPTIQYIVEEAIHSGIEDIIIVTGKGKRAIEDHFDNAFELEENLISKQKYNLLEKVRQPAKVDIYYIRQKEPRGLGHTVWCARKFIGNEPFAVLLGDDIIQNDPPCLKQMMDQFDQVQSSIVAVKKVPKDETNRYGIIDPSAQKGRLYDIRGFVEKPAVEEAPSDVAIIGRYILTPAIFGFLDKQQIGSGGEIQLTDAIARLNEIEKVYGYAYEGKRYDVGETLGFIKSNIEMALSREDLRNAMLHYLEDLHQRLVNKQL